MEIKVLKDILSANDTIAGRNRDRLDKHGILTVNVMASPEAGKTSLILQTVNSLKPKTRIAVIEADVVLINKIDLLPYLDFNVDVFCKEVTGLNPAVKIFPVSCKTGEGLEAWSSWLEGEIKQTKNRL